MHSDREDFPPPGFSHGEDVLCCARLCTQFFGIGQLLEEVSPFRQFSGLSIYLGARSDLGIGSRQGWELSVILVLGMICHNARAREVRIEELYFFLLQVDAKCSRGSGSIASTCCQYIKVRRLGLVITANMCEACMNSSILSLDVPLVSLRLRLEESTGWDTRMQEIDSLGARNDSFMQAISRHRGMRIKHA